MYSASSRNAPGESPHAESTSQRMFRRLDARDLYKEIVRVEYGSYSRTVSDFLSPFKAPRIDRFVAAYRRLSSLQKLELDFELEPGWLVMYCLPFGLGKKLAEVEIVYDDDVSTLTKLDGRLNVSGGHLDAQLNRYDRLWRASLLLRNLQQRNYDLRDSLAQSPRCLSGRYWDYGTSISRCMISRRLCR